ncbi:hypothetical protein DH2020_028448 [Rehmannia glutinosa]|uniref:DUF1985 domain-containing protein n=1 Tax=Rehmannia glutinosa TaxID=99300 RepID=A0ABR0VRD3_REHGL
MDLIRARLKGDNIDKFKNSCFDISLKSIPYSSRGCLCYNCSSDKTMVFPRTRLCHINIKQFVFKPEEFALITGLEFGPKPPMQSKPEIVKKKFGKNSSGYLSDVVSAFKEHAVKEKGKGYMTLKLALLYMLYGVLLVSGLTKKLDKKYIYLVDNLKAFNAYLWGRIAYEFLVSDIRSCMSDRVEKFWKRKEKKKAEKKKDHNMEKFDVSGFTHALQVWAYKVMSDVGKLCAKRVSGSSDATPWILRWKAEDAPTADSLKPSRTEKSSGYFKIVAKWQQEMVAAVSADDDVPDENMDVEASTP